MLKSIESINTNVIDLQSDGKLLAQKIEEKIEKAIYEYKSEVIVLGCTLEIGQFETMQKKYDVPIIDAAVAALKYAEFMVEIRQRCGWKVSKACAYKTPSKEEMIKLKELM